VASLTTAAIGAAAGQGTSRPDPAACGPVIPPARAVGVIKLRGDGHSILAGDYCDQAFQEVRLFLNQYLRTAPENIGKFPRLSEPDVAHELTKEIPCSHAPA